MLNMETKEIYEKGYRDGFKHGLRLMEERILLACESENEIELSNGKVYIIKSSMNTEQVFS